jgi:serine protease Do
MNRKFFSLAVLALGFSLGASAQTQEKQLPLKKKDGSITIRKKGDSNEKTTIVIEGDKITVNGKPLEDLKDSDIEVLRERSFAPLARIRDRVPMGSLRMMRDDFPFGGSRAFLGVASEKNEKGAKINSVEKESAAEKAGLKKDDIITKIGDTKIDGADDLFSAINNYKPEDKVTITYLRDGKEGQVTATLGKTESLARTFKFDGKDFSENFKRDFNFKMPSIPSIPRMDGMEFSFSRKPRLGVEIQDLSEGKGVKILDVDSESAAAKAGLQKDDVITEIDGKAVASVDELRSHVRDWKDGDSAKITYQRAGKTQTATVSFPKKLKTAEL